MSFSGSLSRVSSWFLARYMFSWLITLVTLSCATFPVAAQRTIRVPTDFATVQQAIIAAQSGDTVLVAPGVYGEKVSFLGKSVTVAGDGDGVILDGTNLVGPLVTFANGETRSAILTNVTIQNGKPSAAPSAGGIFILDASPTIHNARILNNQGCGIGAVRSAFALDGSTVSGSTLAPYAEACGAPGLTEANSYLFGGGILLVGISKDNLSAQISGNTVQSNMGFFGGAGITLVDAGFPMLSNNYIHDNVGHDKGAGISVIGSSFPAIVQNLIIRNVVDPTLVNASAADVGAGVNIEGVQVSARPTIITNNTISFNRLVPEPQTNQQGSQMWLGTPLSAILTNNLIIGSSASSLIDCTPDATTPIPVDAFSHNDLFAQGGALISGRCSDPTGVNANISLDPLFQDSSAADTPDFRLRAGSPAIDSGSNSAPGLLPTDFQGVPRIQEATQVSPPTIDMGVYEAAGKPGVIPPPAASPNFSLTTEGNLLTVQTEHHSSIQVKVQPLSGTLGTVTLACSAPLPVYVTCTFTPATLDISDGTTLRSSTLTIDTDAVLRFASSSSRFQPELLWAGLLLPVGLVVRKHRKLVGGSLLFLCFALVGCSGRYPPSTTPGTYSIVVTGTDSISKTVQQAVVTLAVVR